MSIQRLVTMLTLGNLPIFPTVIAASFLLLTNPASADVFTVTETFWGTPGQAGTFAWAIEKANTTVGEDVIEVNDGLDISVDFASVPEQWLATITESVRIEGNGATLIGNPAYATTGGGEATKTNIVASPYRPAILDSDAIVTPAFSFARIGTREADNSSIKVDITDLGSDGLASIAEVRTGATLSVTGGDFTNLVNYTDSNAVGRGVFQAEANAILNISDVSISKHYPFDTAIDAGTDAVAFFGSIIGEDAQLNLQNSTISQSFGAGAIAWVGGDANIVSTVVEDAGGISISDSQKKGELNLVNSILYMTGGDDLSQTNRIQVAGDAVANVIASSVLIDALSVDSRCMGIAYTCNGLPLTATLGGVLNFNSSVAVPLNAELAFPGLNSYSEFSNGNLLADDFSFILGTPTQNDDMIRSLFDNLNIQTLGETFEIGGDDTIDLFLPLPEGATPIFGEALSRVVTNAGIGGLNELINPIDGNLILFDVYGNERFSSSGRRDIGAVQGLAPVPLPSSLLLLMGGMGVLLVRARTAPETNPRSTFDRT